jgi:chemotaxis response regulator CheB
MKAHPDIVAIGASSGGIDALQSLLKALSDIDAIVLIVLHRPADPVSYLRDILFWWHPLAMSLPRLSG